MRGIHRNIALLLVLAATLVASSAEAKVGGNPAAAAAQRMTKGAQVRLNRMKQKMSLRPRGAMMQKTRRMLRLGKRKMVRAMSRRSLRPSKTIRPSKVQLMRASSRREIGLGGSEAARTRQRFARDVEDPAQMAPPEIVNGTPEEHHVGGVGSGDVTPDMLDEMSGQKQVKKMRDRVRKSVTPPRKKIPKRRGN